MATDPKGLIEEIIDNAMTSAQTLDIDRENTPEHRAETARKTMPRPTDNHGKDTSFKP